METLTPYEQAVQMMQNDPTLKHVVYSWKRCDEKTEHSRGLFRFNNQKEFESFVDMLYNGGVCYIGAVHR